MNWQGLRGLLARRAAPIAGSKGFPLFAALLFGLAPILHARCAGCHAARPSQPGIDVAPKGVLLDTPAHIVANAAAIRQQAVLTRAMPLGNLTGMTDDERARLGAWIDAGAKRE